MPFANTNDYLTGRKPIPSGSEIDLLSTRFELDVVAGDLTLNNIGILGALPAGHIPVALLVDADKLDTNGAPTLVLEVGLIDPGTGDISALAADGGGPWGSTTIGQAGGQAQLYSKALARVSENTDGDRQLAVKVTTAAATAAAGVLGVNLIYRAA